MLYRVFSVSLYSMVNNKNMKKIIYIIMMLVVIAISQALPEISLIEPENNSIITADSLAVYFRFNSNTTLNGSFLIDTGSGYQNFKTLSILPATNTVIYAFSGSQVFQWKINYSYNGNELASEFNNNSFVYKPKVQDLNITLAESLFIFALVFIAGFFMVLPVIAKEKWFYLLSGLGIIASGISLAFFIPNFFYMNYVIASIFLGTGFMYMAIIFIK